MTRAPLVSLLLIAACEGRYRAPTLVYGEVEGCGDIASAADEIIQAQCSGCHGPLSSGFGGFQYADLNDLAGQSSFVVPFAPDESRLVQVVDIDYMPKGSSGLSSLEKQTLREWVECGAEPLENQGAREFVNVSAALTAMEAYATQPGLRADEVRFLSLLHVYNAGAGIVELGSYRAGLTKLVYSLTWSPEEYFMEDDGEVNPDRILRCVDVEGLEDGFGCEDGGGVLFALDMRRLGWRSEERALLLESQGLDSEDVEFTQTDAWEYIISLYPLATDYGQDLGVLRDLLGTTVPVVNGDWFAFHASSPPLYYSTLLIPSSLETYLSQFGVSISRNTCEIDYDPSFEVGPANSSQSAGFADSGVSFYNRVISRRRAKTRPDGYCWVSYDFGSSVSDGEELNNIFSNPLNFTEDGGEMICSLPNGMQSYLVTNAAGEILERGPAQVVVDTEQRPDARGDTVITGLSCMRCHAEGIILKNDEVRAAYENGINLTDGAADEPDCTLGKVPFDVYQDVSSVQIQDREGFSDRMEPLLVDVKGLEPVTRLARDYENKLDLVRVAAELGQTEFTLEGRILTLIAACEGGNADTDSCSISLNALRALIPLLGEEPGESGGVIDREVFEQVAQELFYWVYNSGAKDDYNDTNRGCARPYAGLDGCRAGRTCEAQELAYPGDAAARDSRGPTATEINEVGGLQICADTSPW